MIIIIMVCKLCKLFNIINIEYISVQYCNGNNLYLNLLFIAVCIANIVFPTAKSPQTENVPVKSSKYLNYAFISNVGNFI